MPGPSLFSPLFLLSSLSLPVVGCGAVCFEPVAALGQEASPSSFSEMTVTALDPGGAALAGVEVSLVAEGDGAGLVGRTDGGGEVRIAVVAGRRYRLVVRAEGFAGYEADVVGGAAVAPVRLGVAGVSEAVTVEGAGGPDPAEMEVGVALKGRELRETPVNGRSVTDLLAVGPGVTPVSSAQPNAVVMSGVASTPPSGDLNAGALSVSGQRETANAFRVNGADVQEDVNMGIAIVPTLDSVGELKVLTGSFDARLGNASGGQVQVTTRSGMERVHGSAYEYWRNTALDARSYFSEARAPFHGNQFGGTLGGPGWRRGLFWFGDYQGTRRTEGVDTGLIPVPSAAERRGGFWGGGADGERARGWVGAGADTAFGAACAGGGGVRGGVWGWGDSGIGVVGAGSGAVGVYTSSESGLGGVFDFRGGAEDAG